MNPIQLVTHPYFASWMGADWNEIGCIVLSLLVLVPTIGNLIQNRNQGWAWKMLVAVGVVIAVLGRLAIGMFREMASDYDGVGGWDED